MRAELTKLRNNPYIIPNQEENKSNYINRNFNNFSNILNENEKENKYINNEEFQKNSYSLLEKVLSLEQNFCDINLKINSSANSNYIFLYYY